MESLSAAMVESILLGETEESIRLLSEGADANARDEAGVSVLCKAIENGNEQMVAALLDHGADISASTKLQAGLWARVKFVYSALRHPETRDEEVSEFLRKSSSPGVRAIFSLTTEYEGNGEAMMLALIEHGIELGNPSESDSWCNSVWRWACAGGYMQVARILVARGVPIDVPSNYDTNDLWASLSDTTREVRQNPGIFAAVENAQADLLAFLLENGADPLAIAQSDGGSVLMWAMEAANKSIGVENSVAIVRLLVENGADPNICNSKGRSPLSVAITCERRAELAHLLLSFGAAATIDSQDDRGWTALHYACYCVRKRNGKISENFIKILAEAGAKVDVLDHEGHTPLWRMASRGDAIGITNLLDIGAKVDERGPSTSTPLMEACKHNTFEVVRLLIEAGADVNAHAESSNSMLAALKCPGHTIEKMKILLEMGAHAVLPEGVARQPICICGDESYPKGYLPLILEAAKKQGTLTQTILNEALRCIAVRPGNPPVRMLLDNLDGTKPSALYGELNLDDVFVLLEAGAQGTHQFDSGNTILHAIGARNFDDTTAMDPVIQKAMQHGALLDVRNDDGLTAIQLAVQKGNHSTFKALLHAGSDVTQRTPARGETLLHLATQAPAREHTGHIPLERFSAHATHPHLQDARGKMLANAITADRYDQMRRSLAEEDIVIDLVNYPLDALGVDGESRTPLHCACAMGNPVTVSGLVFGEDYRSRNWQVDMQEAPMARDKEERLPMHWAAEAGCLEVVRMLLMVPEGSLDLIARQLSATDREGLYPLSLAMRKGHGDVVEYLSSWSRGESSTGETDEKTTQSDMNTKEAAPVTGSSNVPRRWSPTALGIGVVILLISALLMRYTQRNREPDPVQAG